MKLKFVAPCLFGIEGLLGDELRSMGAENVNAENGRVLFEGDEFMLARANLCSRYAERILILVGSFPAGSFEQLFEGVKALPWEQFVGKDDAFPVKGWSINSALHSIPDIQSIVKKAVVERLKSKYNISWFAETGPVYQIQFSILKNMASLMIDTSGEGLHKRGYRANATAAPIKETLAAAMAYIAHIYPDSTLYDPLCGSGTILIEGALMVNNIAPGLKRSFAAERFRCFSDPIWREERTRAQDNIKRAADFQAIGNDVDENALKLTEQNAKLAGVASQFKLQKKDIADFAREGERGLIITNPPYGERLLDIKEAETIYKTMGQVFHQQKGWRYYIISPHEEFETVFGRPADKRRKLYNGMIKCQMFMYFR